MYTGNKNRLHPRSFRHRIKDVGAHYFDTNHFMGIDPLDHSKFHDIYEPPANLAEDENIFIIELMVPGFNEDQIEVSQEGNALRILGSKEENQEELRDDYIVREHHVSKFQREFTLQESTSMDHIETEMKNGTLKLTIYKNPIGGAKEKAVLK